MELLNIIEKRSEFVKNIYDINMPKQNQKIKITDKLNEAAIISVKQQAQKLILKSMLELGKNDYVFTYGKLVEFMISNKDNPDYYSGSGIKSIDNIKRYWSYSNSNAHVCKINNFSSYYEILILH